MSDDDFPSTVIENNIKHTEALQAKESDKSNSQSFMKLPRVESVEKQFSSALAKSAAAHRRSIEQLEVNSEDHMANLNEFDILSPMSDITAIADHPNMAEASKKMDDKHFQSKDLVKRSSTADDVFKTPFGIPSRAARSTQPSLPLIKSSYQSAPELEEMQRGLLSSNKVTHHTNESGSADKRDKTFEDSEIASALPPLRSPIRELKLAEIELARSQAREKAKLKVRYITVSVALSLRFIYAEKIRSLPSV